MSNGRDSEIYVDEYPPAVPSKTDVKKAEAAPAAGTASGQEPADLKSGWIRRSGIDRFGLLYLAIVLFLIFSLLSPTFLTLPNMRVLSTQNSVGLILALGALVPLVVGEFDLSVGYILGISSVMVAMLSGG